MWYHDIMVYHGKNAVRMRREPIAGAGAVLRKLKKRWCYGCKAD